MLWCTAALWAAALAGVAAADVIAGASVYRDAETGFVFSQYNAMYNLKSAVTFRLAVPSGVPANTPYDAVLQVVAPIDVGWTALAWGGQMLNNPLSVVWTSGGKAIVSSHYATAHTSPPLYPQANLQVFKVGTKVNSTHYQYTAKCSNCTSFIDSAGTPTILSPTGTNRFAFAYASTKPTNPGSNTTRMDVVHDVYSYWNHDFSAGRNDGFVGLVAKNL